MRLFGPMIVLMLVEIALFITVGGKIGLLASLAVIGGTALLGGVVLRRSGERIALDLRSAMSAAQVAAAGGHGLTMLAGVLLILPGFLGDLLGLILLLPPVRHLIARQVAQRVQVRTGFGMDRQQDVVIDGEFIELDPENVPPRGPSGWTRH